MGEFDQEIAETLKKLLRHQESVTLRQGQSPVEEEFEPGRRDELLLGGTRSLSTSNTQAVLANPVDLVRATFRTPRPCALKLQLQASTGNANVVVNILEAAMGADFSRTLVLKMGAAPRTIRLYGRTILATALCPRTGGGAYAGKVAALLTTEGVDWLGELYETWYPGNTNLASLGILLTQENLGDGNKAVNRPGLLIGGEGFLQAFGGADPGPYYLMFFDSAVGALVSGATAPLYTIGPLQAGSEFSFSHAVEKDLEFTQGIFAAFSTTPAVWTQPAATAAGYVGITAGY